MKKIVLKIIVAIFIVLALIFINVNKSNAESFRIDNSNASQNAENRVPVPTMINGFRIYCIQHGGRLRLKDEEYIEENAGKTYHDNILCGKGDVSSDVRQQKSQYLYNGLYGKDIFIEPPTYDVGPEEVMTNQKAAYMLANADENTTYMAIQYALWAMGYQIDPTDVVIISDISNPNENIETTFAENESEVNKILQMIKEGYELQEIIADKASQVKTSTSLQDIINTFQEGVNETRAKSENYSDEMKYFTTQFYGGGLPDDAGFSGVLRWLKDSNIPKDLSSTKTNAYSQLLTENNAMTKVVDTKIEELQRRLQEITNGMVVTEPTVTQQARIDLLNKRIENLNNPLYNSSTGNKSLNEVIYNNINVLKEKKTLNGGITVFKDICDTILKPKYDNTTFMKSLYDEINEIYIQLVDLRDNEDYSEMTIEEKNTEFNQNKGGYIDILKNYYSDDLKDVRKAIDTALNGIKSTSKLSSINSRLSKLKSDLESKLNIAKKNEEKADEDPDLGIYIEYELMDFISDMLDDVEFHIDNIGERETIINILESYRQETQNAISGEILEQIAEYEAEIEEIKSESSVTSTTTEGMAVAGALQNEGDRYSNFYDELQKTGGELSPIDKTQETTTYVDREKGTYTIGPFAIEYLDGYTKSSGISGKRVNFSNISSVEVYRIYYENGEKKEELYKTINYDSEGKQIGDQGIRIVRKDYEYKKDTDYYYPKSNEQFYVQFDSDKLGSEYTIDPSSIKLKVNFDYMKAYNAIVQKCTGKQNLWSWETIGNHTVYCSNSDCEGHDCQKEKFKKIGSLDAQILLKIVDTFEVPAKTAIWLIPNNKTTEYREEITMSISGTVWQDGVSGKESLADGQRDGNEVKMKNVKVTLYECDDATGGQPKVAKLAQSTDVRTNPTLTDENGNYSFEGIWAIGKYFVQYTYNGQEYQATKYTSQVGLEDQTKWPVISNAMEEQSTREAYNQKFSTIAAWPNNYETSNSLGYGVSGKVYTLQTLKGYTLKSVGGGAYEYVRSGGLQLLDDYETNKNNNVIYNEGIISKEIREYMYGAGGTKEKPTSKAQKKYPDEKYIYDIIVTKYGSQDLEIRDKLQFIEDSKITSMTGQSIGDGFEYTLYSLENLENIYRAQNAETEKSCGTWALVNGTTGFRVFLEDGTSAEFVKTVSSWKEGDTTVFFRSTYGRQDNINLGLNPRTTADVAIRKDVQTATVQINGKVQTYDYNTKETQYSKEDIWDIQVRLSDGYYNTQYSREVYPSDYKYAIVNYDNPARYGKTVDDELKLYVTYKLTVRNQSLSALAKINEIVDYYDNEYTFAGNPTLADGTQLQSYTQLEDGSYKDIGVNYTSTYNQTAQSQNKISQASKNGYKTLYIDGLSDYEFSAGEKAYVYLVFEVNKQTDEEGNTNRIILDEYLNGTEKLGKQNVAEINGYSTIYSDLNSVPNIGEVSGTAAGLIDVDSVPGNLPLDCINGDKPDYTKFEDDTDKAPNINIKLYRDNDEQRVISGTTWEDSRTQTIGATTTADGIMSNSETKIDGVTVQLVEIMDNGTEYVWREFGDNASKTTAVGGNNTIGKGSGTGTVNSETPILNVANIIPNYNFGADKKGTYAFKSFPTGNYVVRFIYGDTVRTLLVNSGYASASDENTKNAAEITKLLQAAGYNVEGLNEKSYNGQDYKSTIYQKGVSENGDYTKTQSASDYANNEQRAANSSIYNITKSDADSGLNYKISDAKDIMSFNRNTSNMHNELNARNDVVDYSDTDMMNHIAEVLAAFRNKQQYGTFKESTGTISEKPYSAEEVANLLKELINETKMTAETGSINIEIERVTPTKEDSGKVTTTPNQVNKNTTSYEITNVNLGLEERPKAQLAVEKEVQNVKVTLANNNILFDASETVENVLWQKHVNYQTGYQAFNAQLDTSKFGSIANIRNNNWQKTGLIQISMDEELMHGATITVTYKITVRNVGEVDYKDNKFYYSGEVENPNTIVTTTANQLVDYVANNLQFYEKDNTGWEIVSKNNNKEAVEILTGKVNGTIDVSKSIVNSNLTEELKKYNTIITTNTLTNKELIPEKVGTAAGHESSVSTNLVLTQLITGENDADDLTYNNVVEIVRTSNKQGRRMEYSVAGNQNPTKAINQGYTDEMDADLAEPVKILPPFGAENIAVVIAGTIAVALTIAIGGIIFIKRKI